MQNTEIHQSYLERVLGSNNTLMSPLMSQKCKKDQINGGKKKHKSHHIFPLHTKSVSVWNVLIYW